MQILGKNIRQLPLPAKGDEFHRCQPGVGIVASAALAQGRVEHADVVQDMRLQCRRQGIVILHDTGQPAGGLPHQQRIKHHRLLGGGTDLQPLEQQLIGCLVLAAHQCFDESCVHLFRNYRTDRQAGLRASLRRSRVLHMLHVFLFSTGSGRKFWLYKVLSIHNLRQAPVSIDCHRAGGAHARKLRGRSGLYFFSLRLRASARG